MLSRTTLRNLKDGEQEGMGPIVHMYSTWCVLCAVVEDQELPDCTGTDWYRNTVSEKKAVQKQVIFC